MNQLLKSNNGMDDSSTLIDGSCCWMSRVSFINSSLMGWFAVVRISGSVKNLELRKNFNFLLTCTVHIEQGWDQYK